MRFYFYNDKIFMFASVAKLADAYGSGPYGRNPVGVRIPSLAPKQLLCVFASEGTVHLFAGIIF